jgi:hypothetical protein
VRVEWLEGYEGRKVGEVRQVKRCERLGRWEILGGYGGRNFFMSDRSAKV